MVENKTAAVLDLTDISERIVGEPVFAILGRELFDAGRYKLNVEDQTFELVTDEHRPGGVRVPLSDAKGIKQIPIRIDGGEEILADFDLGNGS